MLIPTGVVLEIVKGQRRTTTRKFYPGYMFVQMDLNDETFHLVKNTPKITGFLGGTKPTPVPRDARSPQISTQMAEGAAKPKPRVSFERGRERPRHRRSVRQLLGHVEEVKPDKQKVQGLGQSMFGRATPVELDFAQVEKA